MSLPAVERIGRAAEFHMSASTRCHLKAMSPEYRAKLEQEWADGSDAAQREVNEAVTPEIRARAAIEWEAL